MTEQPRQSNQPSYESQIDNDLLNKLGNIGLRIATEHKFDERLPDIIRSTNLPTAIAIYNAGMERLKLSGLTLPNIIAIRVKWIISIIFVAEEALEHLTDERDRNYANGILESFRSKGKSLESYLDVLQKAIENLTAQQKEIKRQNILDQDYVNEELNRFLSLYNTGSESTPQRNHDLITFFRNAFNFEVPNFATLIRLYDEIRYHIFMDGFILGIMAKTAAMPAGNLFSLIRDEGNFEDEVIKEAFRDLERIYLDVDTFGSDEGGVGIPIF